MKYLDEKKKSDPSRPKCKVEGCKKRAVTKRNLCRSHYKIQLYQKFHSDQFRPDVLRPECSVDGCEKRAQTKGLCDKHYQQQSNKDPSRPKCKVDGCERRAVRKELCDSHYQTQRIKKLVSDQSRPKCKVEGCERRAVKKDTCLPHYRQQELKNIKNTLFEILGGKKCVACGFTDERALTFDHIYDDGYLDRAGSPGSTKLLKYVKNPTLAKERLQVLCFNCNLIKERERLKNKK
jgi:hypothetical protein